jgi:MinD superfamily P-loop ATPase
MIVAIASGKGGTGKTTVATNLAAVAVGGVQLLDCDVEAPNCHIFLRPSLSSVETVYSPFPVIDENVCTLCGECAEICQYSAIATLPGKTLVFPERCHACRGCEMVCPVDAITFDRREIGTIETQRTGHIDFAQGRLKIGEIAAPALIRAVKKSLPGASLTIIDAPPGTSCPVVATVRGAGYLVLVAEPTPFGLNDLELAVDMAKALQLAFGVVINRCDIGDDRVRKFCMINSIPILHEIPDDRRIAEAYSRGQMLSEFFPEHRKGFKQLLRTIQEAKEAVR